MLLEQIQSYLDTHFEHQGSSVQVEMNDAEHEMLFRRIQKQWTEYGEKEPYASVLSSTDFHMENIAKNMGLLVDSGKQMIGRLHTLLQRNGVELPRGVCVELGCGVGRLTRPLAEYFDKVIALDISPGNLEICKKFVAQTSFENVDTRLLQSPNAIQSIGRVDAFVSLIVLQHNPPPIQLFLLDQILGKINSNGICFFQTATYNPAYAYSVEAHMRLNDEQFNAWSMHCLPMQHIMELFRKYGFKVLEVLEDGLSGGIAQKFHSHTFLARKI